MIPVRRDEYGLGRELLVPPGQAGCNILGLHVSQGAVYAHRSLNAGWDRPEIAPRGDPGQRVEIQPGPRESVARAAFGHPPRKGDAWRAWLVELELLD